MTHCHVPPEPSVRARARNERFLFHPIGRCVRVEERQRPHTTYTRSLCLHNASPAVEVGMRDLHDKDEGAARPALAAPPALDRHA
ncbi:hypothetical protein EVAR_29679_1 [Eumeta japonica]|uniref:Uncharacterized protein n=1 Tax=Eumeta variegata TaxID=151549 RepID=A0A4C1W6S6_EUMVA|nr:hypothetical protein EVAR_29679_1 [Eumeta japonica]